MASATTQSSTISEIRALDPDLPFLASEAAVDLANLRYGQSQRFEAIRRLAARLRNSIKKDDSGAPSRALMDPAALTIVGGAAAESCSADQSSVKVNELLAKAMEIAEFLTSGKMEEEHEKLEEAMNFCAALSRAAIAYRRSIRDLRPSHPYRR